MVVVSSLFSPEVVTSIRWSLGPESSPPLFFESLEKVQKRRQAVTPLIHLNNEDGALDGLDLAAALVEDKSLDLNTEKGQFGRIALGLILLGHGYTDECHNLVTPMSWGEDVPFAANPSIYSECSPEVKSFATYTHSLVHRREAFHIGEFGLSGFQNAIFWSNMVKKCESTTRSLPHVQWQGAVVALSQESKYKDCDKIQEWCQQHGFEASCSGDVSFKTPAIHQLCEIVLQQQKTNENEKAQSDQLLLREFAEQLVCKEIQILLHASLEKAGMPPS